MRLFSAKRAASVLFAAFMTALAAAPGEGAPIPLVPSPAAEDLKSSFNREAVANIYAVSCSTKDWLRKHNVRHPALPFTPRYFTKDDSKVVLYSPYLSEQEKQEAKAAIGTIPRYVMDLFYPKGGVLVFPARSFVEAVPLSGLYREDGKPVYYTSRAGVYNRFEKRAYVTFNTAVLDPDSTNPKVIGYQHVRLDPAHTLHHELGHFMSDILGELGSPFYEFGFVDFTDRKAYVERLEQDLDALAENERSMIDLMRRGYYLPKTHKGKPLYGWDNDKSHVRKEVFAELWAEVQGYGNKNLKAYFPRTFELVRALDRDLHILNLQKSRGCEYEINMP